MSVDTGSCSCRQAQRRLFRIKDAAAYLGKSEWKLRQLVYDRKLRHIAESDGSPWQFDLCDLEQYIEQNRRAEYAEPSRPRQGFKPKNPPISS